VISGEPVGKKRAGPAVRALAIAQHLSQKQPVRLLSTGTRTREVVAGFTIGSRKDVKKYIEWCDIVVFQGYFLSEFPWVIKKKKFLVSDLYAPFQLEHLLELGHSSTKQSNRAFKRTLQSVSWQLAHSDFFICASDKQRDFWIGHLSALGRINPYTADANTNLSRLIAVVPFGIEDDYPSRSSFLRKRLGLHELDIILIWGGGIYDWFDPVTLINAMGILKQRKPHIKLFFLSVNHPNTSVSASKATLEAQTLSSKLELTDSTVFFNPDWVPFDERGKYLASADIGISIHKLHVETMFSYRTRILDYIWAGIPIINSEGDSFSQIIEQRRIGLVAPVGSGEELALLIAEMADNTKLRRNFTENLRHTRSDFSWETTLSPLILYCLNPWSAPDKHIEFSPKMKKPHMPSSLLGAIISTYQKGGIVAVLRKVRSKFFQ
jgi:glycosyltransferase involved in cell wall biosynthesis